MWFVGCRRSWGGWYRGWNRTGQSVPLELHVALQLFKSNYCAGLHGCCGRTPALRSSQSARAPEASISGFCAFVSLSPIPRVNSARPCHHQPLWTLPIASMLHNVIGILRLSTQRGFWWAVWKAEEIRHYGKKLWNSLIAYVFKLYLFLNHSKFFPSHMILKLAVQMGIQLIVVPYLYRERPIFVPGRHTFYSIKLSKSLLLGLIFSVWCHLFRNTSSSECFVPVMYYTNTSVALMIY